MTREQLNIVIAGCMVVSIVGYLWFLRRMVASQAESDEAFDRLRDGLLGLRQTLDGVVLPDEMDRPLDAT